MILLLSLSTLERIQDRYRSHLLDIQGRQKLITKLSVHREFQRSPGELFSLSDGVDSGTECRGDSH